MADAGKNRAAVEEYLRNNPQFVKAWVTNNVAGNELSTWVDGSSKTNVPSQPAEGQGAQANMFKDFVDGKRPIKPSGVKRTKDELLAMDQMDLFMELIRDITNELDVNILCHKILINVGMLTHSDRGSLFLTKKVGTKSYLVSKLFDVTEKAKFKDVLHTEENEIVVPFGVGIAGAVAQSKGHINIKNAYEVSRCRSNLFETVLKKQTRSGLLKLLFTDQVNRIVLRINLFSRHVHMVLTLALVTIVSNTSIKF